MATRSAAPVTHSHAALVLFTGGRFRTRQGGDWALGAGDVLLVPAGSAHQRLDCQSPEAWGMGFCVPCFSADGAASLLDPFERVRDGASPVVHVEAARQQHLEGLFRELAEVGAERRGVSETLEVVLRSLVTLILAEIDRAAGAVAVQGSGSSVVTQALRFIERNCLRSLTVEEIAAAVGRSPAYLTSALTQATGRSASAWVLSGRMADARRRLLHSDERVDVVAERVGYADVTHFIRMFRREHGATPAAWRAARRGASGVTTRRSRRVPS